MDRYSFSCFLDFGWLAFLSTSLIARDLPHVGPLT